MSNEGDKERKKLFPILKTMLLVANLIFPGRNEVENRRYSRKVERVGSAQGGAIGHDYKRPWV